MSATNTGWRLILLESPSPSLTVESNPITLELVSPGPQGPSGSAAAVTSVNGQTGAVVLNAPSVGAAASVHGHAISDVGGLQASLDGKAAAVHGHAIADVTGLQTALDGKAASSHTHSASQISDSSAVGRSVLTAADATSARAALSAAASSHGHAISDVTGLQTALDAKLDDSQASVTGLSILGAADAAAVRSTLGLATTDTPVFAAVEFANGERIRNSTNGRVDIVPAPSESTAWAFYVDMTSFNVGVRLGVIRTSDSAVNPTGSYIVFDTTAQIATDKSLSIHSNDWMQLRGTSTGNDTAQLCVRSNFAGSSGAFALIDLTQLGTATRSPATAHVDPTFYVYSNDITEANDFVRMSHNQTDALIESGNGKLRLKGASVVRIEGSGGAFDLNSTPGNNGDVLTLNGGVVSLQPPAAASGAAGGSLTGTYPNPTIAAAAVADSMLRNSTALSVIGRSANTAGVPADIAATVDGQVLRRSGTTLGFGTIATAGIGDKQVTYAKIQNTSAANVLLGKGSGSAGAIEQITLGANMSMSGSVLSSTVPSYNITSGTAAPIGGVDGDIYIQYT